MTTNSTLEQEVSSALAREARRAELPDPDLQGVQQRVRRRRHRRVAEVTAALVLVLVVGVSLLVRDGLSQSARVETGGANPALPAGSTTIGAWSAIPAVAAGLPAAATRRSAITTPDGALLGGSVPFGSRYDEKHAAIWYSSDGIRWKTARTPTMRGSVWEMAVRGDSLVAVGGSSSTRGASFVWRSDDAGQSWHAIARGHDIFPVADADEARPDISSLARQHGWWVASGSWFTSATVDTSSDPRGQSRHHSGIWVSRNGATWREVLDFTHTTGSCCRSIVLVDGPRRELFAFSDNLRWSTKNPTDWGAPTPITVPELDHDAGTGAIFAEGTGSVSVLDIAPGAGAATGYAFPSPLRQIPGQITGFHSLLLRSDDHGLTWHIDDLFAASSGVRLGAVTRAGRLLVVAGAVDWDAETPGPGAWITRDRKTVATLLDALPGDGETGNIVTVGHRVVFLGYRAGQPVYVYDRGGRR